MVAFLQGDRKFPISALMQPTAEMQPSATDARGKSSNVNEPLMPQGKQMSVGVQSIPLPEVIQIQPTEKFFF